MAAASSEVGEEVTDGWNPVPDNTGPDPVFQLQFEAEAGVRKAEPFSTVTDCPACQQVAIHGVRDDGDDIFIWRQCNDCRTEWRQLK